MLLRRNRRRAADPVDVVDGTGGALTEPAAREVEATCWFHSIDLGNGMVTPGAKSVETQQLQLEALNLPDLSGKRVLDIGAWDGFFSFEAERRGAAHVTALDHHVWCLDHHAHRRYVEECRERGQAPEHFTQVPSIYSPDELPGRAGFDLARRTLRSNVVPVVGDFLAMDLETLGTLDVVLFLGVLYHLEDPFQAMRRLFEVTSGLCIVESTCIVTPGMEDHQMWEFSEGAELGDDPSNWWAGNGAVLEGLSRAAGFSRAELKTRWFEDDQGDSQSEIRYDRAVVHAIR
jgi:tRNA (mo5U34)-methyltransferase